MDLYFFSFLKIKKKYFIKLKINIKKKIKNIQIKIFILVF